MSQISDLLDIGSQNDINRESVRRAWLDEATGEFALPDRLNPLADAFERTNVLQQRVDAGRLKSEFDLNLLSTIDGAFRLVALKVGILAL